MAVSPGSRSCSPSATRTASVPGARSITSRSSGTSCATAPPASRFSGWDNNHPSQQTQAILIRNNLFYDIDSKVWGGNGYFLAMTDGARDITVDHNTIVQVNAMGIVQIDGPPVLGFVFTNNLSTYGTYGIAGTGHGSGNSAIGAFLPGSDISRNVIAGGPAANYPPNNSFPSPAQFQTQFMSYLGFDYRLIASSPWRSAGTDGMDLGAPPLTALR